MNTAIVQAGGALARSFRAPSAECREPGTASAFFRAAYARARQDAELAARDADADAVQACLVQAAAERKLDLLQPDGRRAAMERVGACLSLGLEEAAEGDADAAVVMLRAASLFEMYGVGAALLSELAVRAASLSRRNVVVLSGSAFGLLSVGREQALASLARGASAPSDRAAYLAAVASCDENERLLRRAAEQFPIRGWFSGDDIINVYVRRLFRRPAVDAPCPHGGLLDLFVRSYFVRALTLPDALFLPVSGGLGTSLDRFMDLNFQVEPLALKDLVERTFFEPQAVARRLPAAVDALRRWLRLSTVCMEPERIFDKVPLDDSRDEDAFVAFARESFLAFVDAVKARFLASDDIDVGEEEVLRTWSAWIFVHGVGASRTIADLVVATADANVLLRLPPKLLRQYLGGAERWPSDVKRRMRDEYPWAAVIASDLPPSDVHACLNVAVRHLGPEILRPDNKRLDLGFWMHAWEAGEQPLRDGILALFASGAFDGSLTPHRLVQAVGPGFGVRWGGDFRFLAWLLAFLTRDQPDDFVKGVGLDGWKDLFWGLAAEPEAARLLWQRVPSAFRRKLQPMLPDHCRHNIGNAT